jgi:hypothetical protein
MADAVLGATFNKDGSQTLTSPWNQSAGDRVPGTDHFSVNVSTTYAYVHL